ncbi:MAG: hypothetical protein AAFV46_03000 [Cyanobacteria bacterium J06635_11]
MTVANSPVKTPVPPAEIDGKPSDIASTVELWTTVGRDAVANLWHGAAPELKSFAIALWRRALATQPKVLLICAAVCFMGGFGVMLLALFATALTLLLKVAAVAFAAVALWQWVSGGAAAANRALMAQKPVKSAKVTKAK